ncbi:MAG: radical SAM protein [Clostridiales bacterium]|nr:radical SAM protein [Clostridiales bacterium]
MNQYLKNLERIEFFVTFACTGRCKHCSEGEHSNTGAFIDGEAASDMVRKVAEQYNIKSLMTFGGEPLIYPEEVYKIHIAARDTLIPNRQLITNGFFSRSNDKIKSVAAALAESGITDVLLSVDAFHQETIPVEPVADFAQALISSGIAKLWVHPAWLAGTDADNPYNNRTREILSQFTAMGIEVSSGNIISPRGNALKYLSEYFDLNAAHKSPYDQNPYDITALCVSPDGNVLGGNIYKADILSILENYSPEGEQV